MSTEYEEIVGGGTFVKWESIGETVEGTIVSFSLDGGKDFDGNACPELLVETDDGVKTITCSQANLLNKVKAHSKRFVAGAPVRVTFSGTYEGKSGKPGKEFTVGVGVPPTVDPDEF